eukprot:2334571-Amphidinium_carterae.1
MQALLRPNLEEHMHPPAKVSGDPKHRGPQPGEDGKPTFASPKRLGFLSGDEFPLVSLLLGL